MIPSSCLRVERGHCHVGVGRTSGRKLAHREGRRSWPWLRGRRRRGLLRRRWLRWLCFSRCKKGKRRSTSRLELEWTDKAANRAFVHLLEHTVINQIRSRAL